MSATTRAYCDSCGVKTGQLNADGHCLHCEYLAIQADWTGANVALEAIEEVVRYAVDRARVHPDDILERVNEVLLGAPDVLTPSVERLKVLSRENVEARIAAGLAA